MLPWLFRTCCAAVLPSSLCSFPPATGWPRHRQRAAHHRWFVPMAGSPNTGCYQQPPSGPSAAHRCSHDSVTLAGRLPRTLVLGNASDGLRVDSGLETSRAVGVPSNIPNLPVLMVMRRTGVASCGVEHFGFPDSWGGLAFDSKRTNYLNTWISGNKL